VYKQQTQISGKQAGKEVIAMAWDKDYEPTKDDLDNRSDQLNPNNDAYWQGRGEEGRPDDWQQREDN